MSDQEHFLSQFGPDLYFPSAKSKVSVNDALQGKIVLLYFSAHWCPPCRRFTPMLVAMYNKLKETRDDFEIVFVSLDNKDSEFEEYASTMPWKCVPFEGMAESRSKLAMKYGAQGIPHLVVISETGEIITQEGTSEVQLDPEGKNFPWRPKPFSQIWPDKYLTKNGLAESSSLDSKYLMLYFSAHWCPPCKRFTPVLGEAYNKMKAERDDFELVFVSSDRDEESFNEYFGSMPFCAVPYEDAAILGKRFGISGIPALLMLGPMDSTTGERPLINENVRSVIEAGELADFPFHPKNYQDLAYGADGINENKSLVVLCEGEDDDEQQNIVNAIKKAAETKKDYRFFYATQPAGVTTAIRKLLKMENKMDDAIMVLLDIPDNGGFYMSSET
eukprot:CAMPEP_0176001772 /NCGR_PEP_ID=MMETSP0120_2-20121206/300_1 /TAXON_ID=160619 /ORGANISM="Kryptoperidinium foliaceum, Strain CCMP 1326" /LENGTH=387 /DNA_ID=CAMNT_0017334333 /DNA_START=47 /DNA_END=1207 /DNA_ORIENTATION=+